MKDFTNDKTNVSQKLDFVMGRKENIVGKGEMLVPSLFFSSHNIFKSFFFRRVVKNQNCVVENQAGDVVVNNKRLTYHHSTPTFNDPKTFGI